jgi:crotonobetainyl-CoA:carnitine CoA-transferase CaiB-like acyl-CoA transferase
MKVNVIPDTVVIDVDIRTVPGTTYPCAPGGPNDYVYIFAQPQMWKPLVNAMGKPELADDRHHGDRKRRHAHPERRFAAVLPH